ncbi:hypothetical protein Patl1_09901 [Pistacia atlantica]|uniref:Uncharacterized protein n=1 Tax=Pistacia atlantica TaxID=434234 RepID=A0ACC1A250_9ROSI|nr:hypothetical protein Patl1_09901 [Pistacia atlantica]
MGRRKRTGGSGRAKIYPGDFDITWSEKRNYWKKPKKGSKDPAELIRVCWLQVTGTKTVKTGKSYEITFNISFTEKSFGWNGLPLFMMYKIGENGNSTPIKIKPLEETETKKRFNIPYPEEKLIVKIPGDKGDEKLCFGFYETQSNRWKGGLSIHHATVKEV